MPYDDDAAAHRPDPIGWLRHDRARAQAARDPCAGLCTVASVDLAGHPQARTLVLRDIDGRLAIFLNRTSPKWFEIGAAPTVAVVVWLPVLNLQYRLSCRVEPVPDALVAASWQLRPPMPKRLDWLYTAALPQGSPVRDRDHLLDALATVPMPEPLTAPPTAAGLYLNAVTVDRLDLAQSDGVHDRRHFEHREGVWHEHVRVP
ncbi:MAG: pyridoxamine 5'-phosphate oxidase family protein [Pseudomonadales bacterium]